MKELTIWALHFIMWLGVAALLLEAAITWIETSLPDSEHVYWLYCFLYVARLAAAMGLVFVTNIVIVAYNFIVSIVRFLYAWLSWFCGLAMASIVYRWQVSRDR